MIIFGDFGVIITSTRYYILPSVHVSRIKIEQSIKLQKWVGT